MSLGIKRDEELTWLGKLIKQHYFSDPHRDIQAFRHIITTAQEDCFERALQKHARTGMEKSQAHSTAPRYASIVHESRSRNRFHSPWEVEHARQQGYAYEFNPWEHTDIRRPENVSLAGATFWEKSRQYKQQQQQQQKKAEAAQ
ncbi:hypothetical protein QOT17_010164 [Balamuthia mandrillaris]